MPTPAPSLRTCTRSRAHATPGPQNSELQEESVSAYVQSMLLHAASQVRTEEQAKQLSQRCDEAKEAQEELRSLRAEVAQRQELQGRLEASVQRLEAQQQEAGAELK